MDDIKFWQIIEETQAPSAEEQERKLYERLNRLSEKEVLEFERTVSIRYWELYSRELWGVAYLYTGFCSDDGFMDWRKWIIFCGKEAFETARDRPDDLVPIIDAHPDAGCEGIGYIPMRVLRDKNRKWKHASPEFDIQRPKEMRGQRWKPEDLKDLLPKTYRRFQTDATEQQLRMKDPDYLVEAFGVKLGNSQSFTVKTEEVEIDGQRATRTEFIPMQKKPWWRFW